MKRILFFLPVVLFVISCSDEPPENNNKDEDSTKVTQEIYPNSGNFYVPDSGKNLIVADPIIYDVIVKNPDKSDEWTEYCLQNTDIEAIKNIIYNAILQGRLLPYHYRTDTVIDFDEVKKMIENKDKKIGKMQFEEKWYFNEDSLTMHKTVSYITFGYELINDNGKVYGYEPAFKIYLNKKHNKKMAK